MIVVQVYRSGEVLEVEETEALRLFERLLREAGFNHRFSKRSDGLLALSSREYDLTVTGERDA